LKKKIKKVLTFLKFHVIIKKKRKRGKRNGSIKKSRKRNVKRGLFI